MEEKPDTLQQQPAPLQAQQQSTENGITSTKNTNKNNAAAAEETPPASTTKKPSLPARLWKASGLDPTTLMLMIKGSLPPTIALAIYQAPKVAQIYGTLGYLIAIMSILAMPIMPRAKFIQNIFLDLIGICIGSCIALLAIYCSVQARIHTSPAVVPTANGAPTSGAVVTGYNSSASAVSAIWLFVNIYFVNTLRASRPQLQLPVIMYSIFAMVASTYAPTFHTMTAGIAFVKRLMEAFTLAIAIALGVNFFIFPMSCRSIFIKQSAGMVAVIQGALKAQLAYIQSLEKDDMFKDPSGGNTSSAGNEDQTEPKQQDSPQAAGMKAIISAMGELQGKMYADLTFAKRELGYGKLDAHAIETINDHFRNIMLPLFGMSSIADIFHRVAQKPGFVQKQGPEGTAGKEIPSNETRSEKIKQWNEIMKTLHEPFEMMTTTMCEGMQHVSLVLEITKPPKSSKKSKATDKDNNDVEADAGVVKPGDANFSAHIKERIALFKSQRQTTLTAFMKQVGIEEDEDVFANPAKAMTAAHKLLAVSEEQTQTHKRNQRQLFMVLYMEYLLWSTGRAVLHFISYADSKVADGTMSKKRIINPGSKRLQKWFFSLWNKEDLSSTAQTPDASESGSAGVYSGASFQTKLDPEHLPPANAWERATDGLRSVSRVLGSKESAFGFRVACATLTIGIVAYLKNSQRFFIDQRLVWAMIMVAIGMTTTAGAGIFGFIGRIAGTVAAMCTSFAIWYIVNGHTAGVIVFFFVFTFTEFYFLIKFPKIIVVTLLSIVTQVLIIGYELQVQQTGVKIAESTGQPYYAIYLLGPYRLATVIGGMVVAFAWTFFPYPLTERSQLRKDLGSALYLLANFYSVVHTTVGMRIQGREGDLDDKESPGHKLEKARRHIWEKEMALIASLRQHSAFTVWEPTFGGKFPKKTYDAIIDKLSSLVNFLSLLAYASQTFSHDVSNPNSRKPTPLSNDDATTNNNENQAWITDFARLISLLNPTSQEMTSTLTLLSNAIAQASPLPPYLRVPDPYMLSARLEALDEGILGVKHVLEPGYSAFAVMQIASSVVRDDVAGLIEDVKTLVGEVDFSFHIHSSSSSSGGSSEETLYEKIRDLGGNHDGGGGVGSKGKRD